MADQLRIGVLGSARIEPPDPRHEAAVEVGRVLGEAGHEVLTGGYAGLMGAVSRGAAEAGARVLGLPMRSWTELSVNPWVAESIVVDDFFDRLRVLSRCDALVALDGGVGTLAEVAVTWANLQTDPAVTPPLILVGSTWERLLPALERILVVDDRDMRLLRVVGSAGNLPAAIAEALRDRANHGAPRG